MAEGSENWTNMAHEESHSAVTPETTDQTGTVVAMNTADTPAVRANPMDIFTSRQFEGEDLRMGQVIRRVREAMGLDLETISKETLLRKDYLMWIERMEVGELPKGGYLTAILKTYARHLDLPVEEVIQAYTHECGAVDEVKSNTPVPKIGDIKPERAKWPIAAAAAVMLSLVGLAGFGAWSLVQPRSQTLQSSPSIIAVNGARESLFAETDAMTRPVPDNLPLELVAVRQGWLEVRGADGTIFRSRVMASGESYFPRLKAGWTISARDGGAFEWRVGDLTVGTLGPDGAQVFSISVDEQLALAADASAPALASNGGNKASR